MCTPEQAVVSSKASKKVLRKIAQGAPRGSAIITFVGDPSSEVAGCASLVTWRDGLRKGYKLDGREALEKKEGDLAAFNTRRSGDE